MAQEFLTLEGAKKCRKPGLFGALSAGEDASLGVYNPRLDPRFKAAQAIQAAGIARSAAAREGELDIETAIAQRQEAMSKKLDALQKWSDEGVAEKTPGLFDIYMGSELSGYECDGLEGFFSRFTRMVTPPAKVRKAFQKVVKKIPLRRMLPPGKVGAAMSKGLRYAGATVATVAGGGFLIPPSMRDKAFGLKGGEMKSFNAANKIMKVVAISSVAVVGGAAIMGSMSSAASGGMGKWLAGSAAKKFLAKKVGSIIVKDAAKKGIWKIAMEKAGKAVMGKGIEAAAGKLVGQFIPQKQLPAEDYANLPANVPVATTVQDENPQMPPRVGGSSSMAPGGGQYPPQSYGESEPYDQAALKQQVEDNRQEGFGVPFPTVMTPDPDATPAESETDAAADFDQKSPEELIAQAKAQTEEESGPGMAPDEVGTSSLEAEFEDALALVKSRDRARIMKRGRNMNRRRRVFASSYAKAKANPKVAF